MTQYPNYASPYVQPSASPRPTSVTVLAIIGIIWGVLQILCNLGSGAILLLANQVAAGGPPNPALDVMRDNPMIAAFMLSSMGIRLVLAVALVAAAVAALSLKRWGRSTLIMYSWIMIGLTVIEIIISATVVMPATQQATAAQGVVQPPGFQAGQWAGTFCGSLVGVIYPIFVLIYMNKANVKAAFEAGWTDPQAANPQGAYGQGGYPQGGYPPPTGYAQGGYPPPPQGGQGPPPPAPPNGPYST